MTEVKQRAGWRKICDVGEAMERLENELKNDAGSRSTDIQPWISEVSKCWPNPFGGGGGHSKSVLKQKSFKQQGSM